MSELAETVTAAVLEPPYVLVIVTVHVPVWFPGVTVKVTVAPALAGVALAGLTCATKSGGDGAGDGCAELAVHAIPEVNAAA